MTDDSAIRAEDVMPVRSRISWGAILAGAALALAMYSLLTLLGGAIGWSVSGDIRSENLMTAAAIWAILTTVVSLFVGGYVASQLTVGENKIEAVMYGIITWAVVFALLLWLMASGVRAGFNAMLGLAYAGESVANSTTTRDWEAAARRAGVSQAKIDDLRQSVANAPEKVGGAVQDPQNRQAAADSVTHAAWWAFAGTLLSMLAAAGGALVGSGPSFRLIPVGRQSFGETRYESRVPVRT